MQIFRYTNRRTGEVVEFDAPQPAFAHDWWSAEIVDGDAPSTEPKTVQLPDAAPAEEGGDDKPSAPAPLPTGWKTQKRPQLEALATGLGIDGADKIPNAPGLVEAIEAKHGELVAAAA